MMMSPEAYDEANLKGKSQQDILKESRSLKREINRLKREMEDRAHVRLEMCPTRLTKLTYEREYLERAIRAYEAAGGQYIPAKEEQRSQDFDAALDSIRKLTFSLGGFFDGYETRTYTVSGDKVVLDVDHTLMPKTGQLPVCYPLTKDEFVSGLKEIHMGEWKKDYVDPYVMDGTQWKLEICFDNERKPLTISGSNAYPYNFRDLTGFLGFDEEHDEENDEDEDDQD